MKKINYVLFFIVLFFCESCGLSPQEEKTPVDITVTNNISEESSLFVQDSSRPNKYVFETNDTRFLNENGYTCWTANTINTSSSFETINVEVSKINGSTSAGYGIVFCGQQINGKPYMLCVLITTQKLYTIGMIKNGVFSHLEGNWRSSSYLNAGYGVKNTLNVSYDNITNNFLLKINGSIVTTFTVQENISFSNSRSGLVAVISENEAFPEQSVKVEFER